MDPQRHVASSAPRHHAPTRGERLVAVGVALLANAFAAFLLLRAPSPAIRADAVEAPIEVVWIERSPAPPRRVAVPAVREAATEPDPPEAASPSPPDTALEAVALPRGGPIPADAAPAPVPPLDDENGRPLAAGADAAARARADYARRGVFGAKPADPYARQEDGRYRMQDRSLGGRLRRMTRRADCAELRAQLRAGGNADAVVRAMIERGCTS